MPKLLFVTVPTDEVLNKEGKVRFPGTDAAVEKLTEAGWEVEVMRPDWPKPLEEAKSGGYDAVLVSTFKSVPRSRDAASMLSRMQELPVYTVGVLQKDEAFRTMAPAVGVLRNIGELPRARADRAAPAVSREVGDGRAVPALLGRGRLGALHQRVARQLLAHRRTQRAGAVAVDHAHLRQPGHRGGVHPLAHRARPRRPRAGRAR